MKVFVILISVFLVNLVFAQNRYQEIVETEYRGDTMVLISTKEPVTGIVYLGDKDSDFLKEEQYGNGVRNGISQIYMSKVKVRSENYKDGLLNGEIKWYHGNGKKHYEVFYKEGKEQGVARSWHPNGQLKYEVNMVNGLDEGPLSVFFENGKLQCKLNYVKGKVEGVRTEYYESGNIKTIEFWKFGLLEGTSITFPDISSKDLFRSKISYKAGKKHGKCQWWFTKNALTPSQLECEANYENDEQHGLTTWWYDNGQIRAKAKYKNGKIDGIKRKWHSNGKKASIEKWKLGMLLNEKNWDEKGRIIKEVVPPPPPPVNVVNPDEK